MMIKKLFNPILTVLCILTMLTACADEAVVENTTQPMNGDVTICFDMTVPGLAKATRSEVASVDTIVESLHLFLFDHRGGFTKVVKATSVTNPTYDKEKTEYTSSSTSGFGTYTATIPGNTSIIHFVANYDYKKEGFDENASLGRSENAVMAPLTTTSHLYWGRYTYKQIKDGTTAVLYRNYAKVTAKVNLDTSSESTDQVTANQVTAIDILGWTLCYEPMKASVTPFNDNVPDNPDGTPGNLLDGTPYAFTLSTPFVTLPAPKAERQMTMTTPEAVAEVLAGKESASNPIHCLFEHTEEGYGHELFAIFKLKVTQQVTGGGTKTTTRYYKIKLLEDTKKEGNTVIERTPYDIIRNHEYIITFKGIEPEGGYGYTAEDGRNEQEAIRLAMIGLPANNSTVDIEMTIPEVQSADYVLRVEGSTIRYYKDITAANTTIDDIIVYFAPLNGDTATWASNLTVSWENTTWDSGTEGNAPALTLSATDEPNYYKISFTTNPFEEDENGNKHYKYGVIRITEKKEYLLSRFVQVFIGDPITFRPLLISSDIPSRTDERLTVVLNVPDLDYLPKELYPIQLTFGSNRVDVEKNLDVEQMKIDFDKAEYNNVLQYLSKNSTGVWSTTNNGDGTWAWTTAGTAVPNTWGYKYIYTLESPEDAGIHRITLRTVTDSITDFKVLLEGKSLVTGTQVFNTRELEFKMQDEANGTDERRIMIDGAMEETRLTTAYLFKLDQTGTDDITVNYTLGLYDEENRTAIPQTPSGDVILWVYYDHKQLTPPTDLTPKKDAENNWFVELTHDVSEKGAAGSITFTATDVVKDAVVFITARGTANYGDYNESYYTTDTSEDDPTLRTGYGNYDFLYTGVNAAALSYRSASAIINVLSTWSFNPATSTDGVEYKQESEVELPYGKDSLLYVRIEKPANTSGVILKLTSPTLQIQANDTYYTIKDLTNGIIELEQTTGDFCYLKFLTTQYASAGELKLEAINEQTSYGNVSYKSTVPYDEATVTVTNKANTFAGFAYATEDVLDAQGTSYGTADADRTVRAVKGSRVGVRVFFPGSFKEQTESFTFKMKSACYELHNDANYKYSGAKTDIGDGSHIITVEKNGLTYDEAKDLCYLDLVLSATTWDNEETIRFLTDATTDATNYIRFYPYNVSIISNKQDYPITVEQSLDKSIWSTITDDSYTLTSASLATQGTSVYYRITLPAVGPYTGNKTFDFTIISDGLEVDNTNSSIAGVQKNDNDTIVFKGLTPKQNDEATWILALKTSKVLESGSNITATILSGETVKPDTLESVLNNGGFLVKYQLGSETAEGVVAPESESVEADKPQITIPKNFTLYKEGYTLTAWKDEEGTKYAIGTKVTVTKNMTLTPVFTENTVSLDDRKKAVTIYWDFQRQNGAPTVAWEGKTGLVWVAQAIVTNGGTTETIDVKLDISPSGKLANGNWVDWAQINGGTTFTIPSQNKATVKVESYNDILYNYNAETIPTPKHMTIAGEIIDETSTKTPTYTYEGTDKEIDIVFGDAGSYYRYVEVTLPEHNVIPTTDDVPFYIRRGILYDNGTESDYSSQVPHFEDDDHIDYMQDGDYALYKIYNTEESYYKVSFMAASHKDYISGGDVSVTVSLVAENGTEYLTNGTVDIIEGSSWSDYQTYMLTTTQTVPIGNYTLKVTFNNTAGSTTCNLKDISLTKTDRPQMTVDWVDANGNVLNNAYSCYVGEKIYLRMKADTDGTIPFKLELRQSTTSTNPGKNNNPAEILKQIETNIPNFTVNTIGTEVGLTNVRVGDIYTICYEVMQAGYLLFKISSDMPAGASNYTTLFNILGKTDVSGTTPLVTVTVNNITFSNPQYRISGTDTWLDISNDYVSIGYGTGSLIDVRINTNGYTTDNITFNWGNSTDYSNASIVTEGSNTYAVMKNIPAYSNSVNFYNGSNSENTYSFQIATEEAKTYEMYVESSDGENSAYIYKENSNIIESSNSIIAIAGTRNRVGEKTIDGQSFTAYHGLKSDDADNDSGNQTLSINTTGYGKKMFLTLYATNKFKYTAANSSTVLITPTDYVFAAELEVGTTKIHRGVGDYYDANGNLYTAAGEGLTQVGEVAIYYVKVSNVNTNQSE